MTSPPSPPMLKAAVRAGIAIDPDEPTDVMVTLERNALAALDDLFEQLEAYEKALEEIVTVGAGAGHLRRIAATALEVSSPAISPEEELVTDENLAARVQQVQHLMDKGDEAELIAYLIQRPIEDVRRVVGSPAISPKPSDSPFPQPALESSEKGLGRDREIPGKPADYVPADIPLTPEQEEKAGREIQMRAVIYGSSPASAPGVECDLDYTSEASGVGNESARGPKDSSPASEPEAS